MTTFQFMLLLGACAACTGAAFFISNRRFASAFASHALAAQEASDKHLKTIDALKADLAGCEAENQALADKLFDSLVGKLGLTQRSVSRRQQNQRIAKELNMYLSDNGFAEMVDPKLHLADDLCDKLAVLADFLEQEAGKRASA